MLQLAPKATLISGIGVIVGRFNLTKLMDCRDDDLIYPRYVVIS